MRQELERIIEQAPSADRNLYQKFDLDEEIERVSSHYEKDPEFFLKTLDSKWSSYSSAYWKNANTLEQAQERKFDEYARMAKLKPGMRILDIGCGWGGPLVYLCSRYDAIGTGITISPKAIPVADERAIKHKAKASFEVCHWQEYRTAEPYDLIFCDEASVHFNDLDAYFKKCNQLLKPGGMVINKELHFNHSRHEHALDRLSQHVNKLYAYTGNYRTLHSELTSLDNAGFSLNEIFEIPIEDYKRTINEHWLKNVATHNDALVAMTSKEYIREFKLYMRGISRIFSSGCFRLHIISATKA